MLRLKLTWWTKIPLFDTERCRRTQIIAVHANAFYWVAICHKILDTCRVKIIYKLKETNLYTHKIKRLGLPISLYLSVSVYSLV